ncbi:magnesium and cobalt transport protein CorA, putative (plasmid) [Sinorhizobium fredii CCBAU 83666]|nr:magnesium and cobalt transport protein CorA, putative [Sinorhizobium fredii CCBAU 83666]GLS07193.1 hypothetical protein GCM10007864_08190 [Sinorhizobium fredii]
MLEGDKIFYGETSLFVGRHHVISVRQGSACAHTEFRSQLEASPQLSQKGPDYVLHAMIEFSWWRCHLVELLRSRLHHPHH